MNFRLMTPWLMAISTASRIRISRSEGPVSTAKIRVMILAMRASDFLLGGS